MRTVILGQIKQNIDHVRRVVNDSGYPVASTIRTSITHGQWIAGIYSEDPVEWQGALTNLNKIGTRISTLVGDIRRMRLNMQLHTEDEVQELEDVLESTIERFKTEDPRMLIPSIKIQDELTYIQYIPLSGDLRGYFDT